MEPHWATLRRYSPERAFEPIIAPQWEAFCGEGFERLCCEALALLYVKEGVSGHFDVGEYWDRAVQIDVVGLRADGWVDLGECRWQGRAWELHKLRGSWLCGRRTERFVERKRASRKP